MFFKKLKLPMILLACGLLLAVGAYFCTSIVKEPTITENDFQYSVTYQLNGETQTISGVYRCKFNSVGSGIDPMDRYYEGTYVSDASVEGTATHLITKKGDLELCVIMIFTDDYLMGDCSKAEAAAAKELATPYLAVCDKEGYEYSDEETLAPFNVALVSWELPQPVDNTFVFRSFSYLYEGNMLALTVVGLLTILACLLLVKKDAAFAVTPLNKLAVVFNCLITFIAIPFTYLIAGFTPLVENPTGFFSQLLYCVPMITAFSVAASLSLRRKGYEKAGFCAQFAGLALFVLAIVLSTIFA